MDHAVAEKSGNPVERDATTPPAARRKRKVAVWNPANMLTFARVVSIPIILVLALWDAGRPGLADDWGKAVACLLTLFATVSDIYDGILARQYHVETKLGKFFDPVADKLLVTALFTCFVAWKVVPIWVAIVIICREFIVMGLRLILASEGIVATPTRWAKFKTVFQDTALVAVLLFESVKVAALSGTFAVPVSTLMYYACIIGACIDLALLFTVVTGVEYLSMYWHHLEVE